MKTVIFAAGRGRRFGDLTKDTPKILLPVLGKPFLYYYLELLKKGGLDDFLVITGHMSKKIEEWLKDYDPRIKIVDQFERIGTEKYGSACPLMAAELELKDEQFIALYGDNLFDVNDIKSIANDDNYCYVSGYRLSTYEPEKYGELVTDGELLKEIIEKPKEKTGDLINIGLYKFTPDIFRAIAQIGKSERGEYELVEAVNLLAKESKVRVRKAKGFWVDFGTPGDKNALEKFLKEKGYGEN